MKVCLINKYYLPDQGITARSAAELVEYMSLSGHWLHIVSTSAQYNPSGESKTNYGTLHTVRAAYNGKGKIFRLMGSILESKALVRKALSLRADIYIVMTSPPLLNYYAVRAFRKKGIPWIYWSLDLYPEAFRANGLIAESNVLYKFILRQSYSYAPEFILKLGEMQGRYLKEQFGVDIPSALMPCGVFALEEKPAPGQISDVSTWKKEPDKIYFAYIGNLGEAHSLDFLKTLLRLLDEKRHRLILVLYGSRSVEMKEYAQAFNTVEILDYLSPNDFRNIDIHLASLLPAWVNICVPSKIVTAVSNSSVFLFYGTERCDSWQHLGEAGWIINSTQDMSTQLQLFLDGLDHKSIHLKKEKASQLSLRIRQQLLEGYEKLNQFLKAKEK